MARIPRAAWQPSAITGLKTPRQPGLCSLVIHKCSPLVSHQESRLLRIPKKPIRISSLKLSIPHPNADLFIVSLLPE